MKYIIISLIIISSFLDGVAQDVNDFVNQLNTNWVNQSYTTCWNIIETALSTNTTYLPALVAKACYYIAVDGSFAAATNIFGITDPLVSALSASNQNELEWEYEMLRDNIITALKVPDTNAPTSEMMEYFRDELYPTNYPEAELLLWLDP